MKKTDSETEASGFPHVLLQKNKKKTKTSKQNTLLFLPRTGNLCCIIIIVVVYVYVCARTCYHMEPEDKLVKVILSFYPVGSGGGTWVTRLGWQQAPLSSKPSC